MPGGKDKFLNSVRALAIRKQDEGDTSDLGMVNFENVEIGMEDEPLRFDFGVHSVSGNPDLARISHQKWTRSVDWQ